MILQHLANGCSKHTVECRYNTGPIYHNITYDNAMTGAECVSDFNLTTDTPYLALMGEIWDVYCEAFGDNWPCYNDTKLYSTASSTIVISFSTWWADHLTGWPFLCCNTSQLFCQSVHTPPAQGKPPHTWIDLTIIIESSPIIAYHLFPQHS